jgi:hypothetical protein
LRVALLDELRVKALAFTEGFLKQFVLLLAQDGLVEYFAHGILAAAYLLVELCKPSLMLRLFYRHVLH